MVKTRSLRYASLRSVSVETTGTFLRSCLAMFLGAMLAAGMLATNVLAQTNGSDAVLDALFDKLKTATDPFAIQTLEQAIWEQWTMVPDMQQRGVMMRGISEMQQQELQSALATFSRLIALAPDLSEAWNKRATVQWLLGNFPASLADICETIKREPRHFGAYSGLGMISAEKGENGRAVAAFELARKYNPHIVGIESEIARLKALGGDVSSTDPLGCNQVIASRD